jgi:metallo-beta-lactamase family protein
MKISFLGAAGCVTGSKHLLDTGRARVLVDCGLFQGLKELRQRNWQAPGFDPGELDAVVLTHAHIDHSGWLPRLSRQGYEGPVHCTAATAELLDLLLMDSAHLQEEDAEWANKKGFSKHKPALPLYTSVDALRALRLLVPHPYDQWVEVAEGVRVRHHNVGHILGASFLEMKVQTPRGSERTIVFSGDIGRFDVPLHRDPEPLPPCDVLVTESTYGDREHSPESIREQIARAFAETIDRRGVVLIPAFAVGRVQLVTLILRDLMMNGGLPEVPIHIDSPMAVDATLIYGRHLYDYNLEEDLVEDGRSRLFPREVHLHRTVHESKMLNKREGPMVIISSSGMMTGGRILHHLTRRLGHPENLILLVGYQAAGTRGRALQEGAQTLRIHGQEWPVICRHLMIDGLSSHADRHEILRWIGSSPTAPAKVFVVHGEPDQSSKLAVRVRAKLGKRSRVAIPTLGQSVQI